MVMLPKILICWTQGYQNNKERWYCELTCKWVHQLCVNLRLWNIMLFFRTLPSSCVVAPVPKYETTWYALQQRKTSHLVRGAVIVLASRWLSVSLLLLLSWSVANMMSWHKGAYPCLLLVTRTCPRGTTLLAPPNGHNSWDLSEVLRSTLVTHPVWATWR